MSQKKFLFYITLTNKQYQQIQKLKKFYQVKTDADLFSALLEKSNSLVRIDL